MNNQRSSDVMLRLWADGDLPLLERLMGDPVMTTYLGGPEPLDQIRKRHERYCQIAGTGKGRMFVIEVGSERLAAGSVGYWESESHGQPIWETGWSVLPEFQGRGIATKATVIAIEQARAEGNYRFIHAFPSVDHAASNAICRKVGFTLQGEIEFEYWREPGKFLRCNDWRFDLAGDALEDS